MCARTRYSDDEDTSHNKAFKLIRVMCVCVLWKPTAAEPAAMCTFLLLCIVHRISSAKFLIFFSSFFIVFVHFRSIVDQQLHVLFRKFLFKAKALRLTSIPSHSGWKPNGIYPNAEKPLSYLLLLFFINTVRSQLTVSLCIANFLHFILEFGLKMHSYIIHFMWYRTLTRISSRFSCPWANGKMFCSLVDNNSAHGFFFTK